MHWGGRVYPSVPGDWFSMSLKSVEIRIMPDFEDHLKKLINIGIGRDMTNKIELYSSVYNF